MSVIVENILTIVRTMNREEAKKVAEVAAWVAGLELVESELGVASRGLIISAAKPIKKGGSGVYLWGKRVDSVDPAKKNMFGLEGPWVKPERIKIEGEDKVFVIACKNHGVTNDYWLCLSKDGVKTSLTAGGNTWELEGVQVDGYYTKEEIEHLHARAGEMMKEAAEVAAV